ncbi:MAG: hypothetical protein HC898_13210 [Phycisphaerales bacterium]|nr:hypothetical protein [Phycisphaerales bacterium]
MITGILTMTMGTTMANRPWHEIIDDVTGEQPLCNNSGIKTTLPYFAL